MSQALTSYHLAGIVSLYQVNEYNKGEKDGREGGREEKQKRKKKKQICLNNATWEVCELSIKRLVAYRQPCLPNRAPFKNSILFAISVSWYLLMNFSAYS